MGIMQCMQTSLRIDILRLPHDIECTIDHVRFRHDLCRRLDASVVASASFVAIIYTNFGYIIDPKMNKSHKLLFDFIIHEYVIHTNTIICRQFCATNFHSVFMCTYCWHCQQEVERENSLKPFFDKFIYLHCRKSHDGNKICVVPVVIEQLNGCLNSIATQQQRQRYFRPTIKVRVSILRVVSKWTGSLWIGKLLICVRALFS